MVEKGRKKFSYEKLKRQILESLSKGEKTRKEICEDIGGEASLPKATLSDVLSDLQRNNIIDVPKGRNRKISLTPFASNSMPKEFSRITKGTLIKWVLLFYLASEKRDLSLEDIKNNVFYPMQSSTIRKHLIEMNTEGLIEIKKYDKKNYYCLAEKAPVIILSTYEELFTFFTCYKFGNITDEEEKIADRIRDWFEWDEDEGIIVRGRKNTLKKNSMDIIKKLLDIPYEDKKIKIVFKSNGSTQIFATGRILYSTETNEFYLLGKIKNKKKKESITIVSFASIKEISFTEYKNLEYGKKVFDKYIDEMFGLDTGELLDVEILFRKTKYTEILINRLKKMRPNARITEKIIEYDNENKERILRYEDNIRGYNAIRKILRTAGTDAVVIKPENLKKGMIDTAIKINDLYDGENA